MTNTGTGVITGASGTAIDATAIGADASPGGVVMFSNAGRVNGSVILNDLPNPVTLFTGSNITGKADQSV